MGQNSLGNMIKDLDHLYWNDVDYLRSGTY